MDDTGPRRRPRDRPELIAMPVDVASALAHASRIRLRADLYRRAQPAFAWRASRDHVRAGRRTVPHALVRRPTMEHALRCRGATVASDARRRGPRVQLLPPRQSG